MQRLAFVPWGRVASQLFAVAPVSRPVRCSFTHPPLPVGSVSSELLCLSLSLVTPCLCKCGFPHMRLVSLSVGLVFESGGLKAGWGF